MPPSPLTRCLRRAAFGLLALFVSHAARAQDCTALGAGGQLPVLDNPRMAQQTQILCSSRFAVLYSGLAREPLWAAEHLDAAMIRAAMSTPRKGEFHPDTRIPPGSRAELEDYVRSGYDRGHMVPSGDMPDLRTQEETFALSNIVPQRPVLNREKWAMIESGLRRLALSQGELYVVSGPAFHAASLSAIGTDRILVPTSTWKAVYAPARQQTGVYVCHNVARNPGCSHVSVAELTHMTGVDPFPALPARMKQTCMTLPFGRAHTATSHTRRRRRTTTRRHVYYRW
ncbi:DNA/RNA non-specific endonuclease [Komagataeibacter medellinensis]|uniref:Endonuclease n=2 Tax=Komagataeibacter medellinensis TaxID=1177712 RepID=G2I0R5_KOMMN|nr:DNA/RNA non-specific endonuclease [Komagataeibacter medellinensis]KAB8124221.1 DNA/RNA non-specific endonuclease [Komagataeibacter medellinensis]BAK84523.1 endonuclease [Komagataeibacter medellinensis NBRC 3288]